MSMGFLRPCADMLEHYSCGGSPYWATKAFNLLMIPPADPFWKTPEAPLPIQLGNYSRPIKKAGILLVGDKRTGHVQLVNGKSYHDKPEYNDKYTKQAYSSVFSYDARRIYGNVNCDNVLQFSADGINFRQRWEMETLHCETDFVAARYPLHEVDPEGAAQTAVLVKDDLMINFHQVTPTKPLVLREGAYPLGFDEGEPEVVSVPGGEAAFKDGKLTFIRNLGGYTRQSPARSFADDVNGANVRYERSVVPVLSADAPAGRPLHLASLVLGRIGDEPIASLMALVPEVDLKDNQLRLAFHDGERAFMQIGTIAAVSLTLNGKAISGEVVMARVSADGKTWSVLRADGSADRSAPG
jgi:hypothetical protein